MRVFKIYSSLHINEHKVITKVAKSIFASTLQVLLLCVILLPVVSTAYTETFIRIGGVINDYKGSYYRQEYDIQIHGLPPMADTLFGLESVLITLHHQRVSDLKITLESPNGTSIWLTNRNGKDSGQNYLNTRFSQFGADGLISAGVAPFTGNYRPDGQLEFFNNGQNPNGIWKLFIEDLKEDVSGSLDSIQLQFGKNPARLKVIRRCDFENIGICDCPDGKEECELLPDLVIVPYFTENQIQEYPWNDKVYPGQIRFAATIANIGFGPMEIKGTEEWVCGDSRVDSSQTCPDGSMSRLRVNQRIYSKNNRTLTFRDKAAGTMYFENLPGHNHFHVDDWVDFRLVQEKKGRRKILAKGKKISYCLFTTGIFYHQDSISNINGKNYGESMPNYGLGNYPACNFDKQGISVGGYDTYGMLYEGQFLNLPKNLKNGEYIFEIEIDPHNWYKELDKSNNIFRIKFNIQKQQRN